MITLKLHGSSSLWRSTLRRTAVFDISFNSLSVWLPSVLELNILCWRSWGSHFFSDRKILAFTSLTCPVCPLPVSPVFLYPAAQLIPWYCGCLWRTGNETLFFPSNPSSQPFITQKPRVPAMAVSHSPNELILQEGRIPSYLCRVGLSSLWHTASLSLFSPLPASPTSSVHITVAKIRWKSPWSVVFSLQVGRWESQGYSVMIFSSNSEMHWLHCSCIIKVWVQYDALI